MTIFSPQNPVYPELSNPASDPYGNFVPATDQSQPAQGNWLGNVLNAFGPSPLGNIINQTGPTGADLPNPVQAVSSLNDFFTSLLNPETWARVGMIVVGIIFLAIGLYMLADRKIDITNVVASGKALAA